jgi:hypothetical protein
MPTAGAFCKAFLPCRLWRPQVHRFPHASGSRASHRLRVETVRSSDRAARRGSQAHRYGYDHAARNCGIRFVEVETSGDLERAVNDRTAMMLFFNVNDPVGKIKAADAPPVEALSRFTKMGFDLVTFSGGKGLRGPQSCGMRVAVEQ